MEMGINGGQLASPWVARGGGSLLQCNAHTSDQSRAQAHRYAVGLTIEPSAPILVDKVWLAAKQGNRKSVSSGVVAKRCYLAKSLNWRISHQSKATVQVAPRCR